MSLLSMDARKDKKISEVLKELVVAMGGAEDPSEVEGKRIAEVLEALKECVSEGGPGPSGVATLATPITYANLVGLRDAGKLTPGMMYRITDYECTVRLSDTDDNLPADPDPEPGVIVEPPGEISTKSINPGLKAKLGGVSLMASGGGSKHIPIPDDSTLEARTVSHPYDIIVIADNEHTLNENARACLRDGDTYYTAEGSVADLAAWELKYTLDNDRSRFSWADPENGKGVVYWLKDEHNNECPYDFKQIQFKRYKITEFSANPDMVGKWVSSACGTPSGSGDDDDGKKSGIGSEGIIYDPDDYVWAYTFSHVSYETQDDEGSEDDGGKAAPDESDVMPVAVVSDWSVFQHGTVLTHENKIGSNMFVGMDAMSVDYYVLPDNVFITDIEGDEANAPSSNTFGNECSSNTFGNGCSFNTFGNGCSSNTFGNEYRSNTFGNECSSNTFGNWCSSNTFGNECSSNTFGNGCSFNTFGNGCSSNTFGDECNSNTFGNGCFSNTFGNGCSFNTFGNGCSSNTFGNWCSSNTFGNGCSFNTFGNGCSFNTFGDSAGNSETSAYCRWCTFEDGVQYVQLTNSSATNNSRIQNYHVLNGTQGTSSGKITISASLGLAYCTFVGKNSSGDVKTWVPADSAQ